jgi:hypothetical protein
MQVSAGARITGGNEALIQQSKRHQMLAHVFDSIGHPESAAHKITALYVHTLYDYTLYVHTIPHPVLFSVPGRSESTNYIMLC